MAAIELDVVNKSFYTDRKDNWRVKWISFLIAFSTFAIYSLVVVIFDFDNGVRGVVEGTRYASPFYGPDLGIPLPAMLPFAFATLWAPFGFRGTCYYMRRVYYRSVFQWPPSCAVEGIESLRGQYSGERNFPFWLNNFHRYFLYLAILLGLYHWYEVFEVFQAEAGGFYLGLGSILALVDAVSLTLYITSCHAFRHIFGGGTNRPGKQTHKVWGFISRLNTRHGFYFWLSLFSIWAYDLYIRLVAWGLITEVRFF